MIKQKYVDEYINLYRTGKVKFNKERIMLIEYLERDVLSRDDLYFNDEMIENCIKFGEKWYFPLQPFQKFLIAFVFLHYKNNNRNFYRKFLWMLGRGGGKNGLLSVLIHFLISELHGIPNYHVSIIANSEEQAKTSPDEVHNTIKNNEVLQNAFKTTLTQTISKKTNSYIKYRTSNGDTKDGLRDGMVGFDEVHRYETNKDVRVHISGLGKKPNPREFYIGTDGYVREGFLDSLKDKAMKVLKGKARANAIFPFMCKLNEETEMDEPENWELANPMLSLPLSEYAQGLYDTIYEEYEDLEDDPSNRQEFLTKRMNLPVVDLEVSVANEEEIMATNRELPNLKGREAIGAIDFASIRDMASVGMLFRDAETYYFITHAFIRKETADKYYGYSRKSNDVNKEKFAPIKEWEEQGLLTVIDEPSINPQHIVDWFTEKSKEYSIKKIVGDNFRLESIKRPLEDVGFEVEVIRRSSSAGSLLDTRLSIGFAHKNFVWGDNPLLRWCTRNVKVRTKSDGNRVYEKKDPFRRKTDSFHCFIHALWRADDLAGVSSDWFDDMDW
ncbi:terminase TerL endonuclease subunit [Alkalicoccobacillus gibsonii]|uniref:terminase TerL endonuclease subunit n=1 Tax=Alkalicoccobacillus gibsonii TaxID=79881 RepID=UPI001932BA4E|nr:terminase TerL endonuclease subunit [Alkalicoccobacillus gibsonii]MBM0064774.1 terminase large subunit [Alkalicoccobacillus gibsonii]